MVLQVSTDNAAAYAMFHASSMLRGASVKDHPDSHSLAARAARVAEGGKWQSAVSLAMALEGVARSWVNDHPDLQQQA